MPDLTNEKVLLNYKLVDGGEDLVDFASGPNTNRIEDNYGIINVSFACGQRHNSPKVEKVDALIYYQSWRALEQG